MPSLRYWVIEGLGEQELLLGIGLLRVWMGKNLFLPGIGLMRVWMSKILSAPRYLVTTRLEDDELVFL